MSKEPYRIRSEYRLSLANRDFWLKQVEDLAAEYCLEELEKNFARCDSINGAYRVAILRLAAARAQLREHHTQ